MEKNGRNNRGDQIVFGATRIIDNEGFP